MVQSLTLFVSEAQIFGCCKNRRDAAHLQQPLWEASAHLENSLVPLATARAGEGQGFFCIIPYPAFLSTAALQNLCPPVTFTTLLWLPKDFIQQIGAGMGLSCTSQQ